MDHVRDGAFFTLPPALPRGRHSLPREQVQRVQRERMMAAVTELLAANGYAGFGPADIAQRAGVSLAAFYDSFENKDACIFAGYDRFIEVLLGRMLQVDIKGLDRPALVREHVHAYIDTLDSDHVVARAFQMEIDALGAPARQRRRESLGLFANYLQSLVTDISDGRPPEELSWSAYIGVVYAVRQLASDALEQSRDPDLSALADEVEPWLVDLFREREASGD